jgi:predicted dithiol-disulfide oxidoreductase (DUF899 family)
MARRIKYRCRSCRLVFDSLTDIAAHLEEKGFALDSISGRWLVESVESKQGE